LAKTNKGLYPERSQLTIASLTITQKAFAIRQFEPRDIEEVVQINQACLPENYSPHFFFEIYESCKDAFLVAQIGRRIVGYIMCRIELSFSDLIKFRLARKGHIISIAVRPEARRQGIGTALVNSAMRALEGHNVEECFLEVRVNNEEAISMYKGLAFQIVRRIPFYYQDGTDAYLMAKRIRN